VHAEAVYDRQMMSNRISHEERLLDWHTAWETHPAVLARALSLLNRGL